jgi:hypothetical protein
MLFVHCGWSTRLSEAADGSAPACVAAAAAAAAGALMPGWRQLALSACVGWLLLTCVGAVLQYGQPTAC